MPERPFPDLNKPNGCAKDLGALLAAGSVLAAALHLLIRTAPRRRV